MPCVLIEMFFVDTQSDASKYNAKLIASTIYKSITGKTVQATVTVNEVSGMTPNATIRNNIQVVDASGNAISGRMVYAGDRVEILDVSYSTQLVKLTYPVSGGTYTAYIPNNTSNIAYDKDHSASVISSCSVYQSPGGASIGSLSAGEYVTPIGTSGSYVNVVYDTVKGENTKSGYVSSSNLMNWV
jgi:hypothetical protein